MSKWVVTPPLSQHYLARISYLEKEIRLLLRYGNRLNMLAKVFPFLNVNGVGRDD
jgi:hypothetical protein